MKIALAISVIIIVVLSSLLWLENISDTDDGTTIAPNPQLTERASEDSVSRSNQVAPEGNPGIPRESDSDIEPVAQTSEAPSSEDGMMQALPGLTGFEIPTRVRDLRSYAEQLAAEPEDGAWASAMEARIYAELSAATVSIPTNMVQVTCRTTWCGVVIDYSTGLTFDDIRPIYLHLENAIPSAATRNWTSGRRDGSGFLTIYAQYDR